MTKPRTATRTLRVVGVLLAGGLTAACGERTAAPALVEPGEPYASLTPEERGRFLRGRALFERLATEEEGLGPLFNAERCSSCHSEPAVGGHGSIRVLKATRFEDGRCSLLPELGGDNLQQRVTVHASGLGVVVEEAPEEATGVLSVTSPPLFGLGLLAAVSANTIAERADPDDQDGDGISGRVPLTDQGHHGRFGRKGEVVDLAEFVDNALRFELGFTTPDHPVEERSNGRPLPSGADLMEDPEIGADGIELLTDYLRWLAPVAPSPSEQDPEGPALFADVGCASCHVPEIPLDEPFAGYRRVPGYTDLLLHDLGGPSGDVCAGSATPGEYRTAPLWGLRYRNEFMVDGLAGSLVEAIGRHGGEGTMARQRFDQLSQTDKDLLLRFLQTL